LEGNGWIVLNGKYGEGQSRSKLANPDLPGKMVVKLMQGLNSAGSQINLEIQHLKFEIQHLVIEIWRHDHLLEIYQYTY